VTDLAGPPRPPPPGYCFGRREIWSGSGGPPSPAATVWQRSPFPFPKLRVGERRGILVGGRRARGASLVPIVFPGNGGDWSSAVTFRNGCQGGEAIWRVPSARSWPSPPVHLPNCLDPRFEVREWRTYSLCVQLYM
jgi:hypothetical protein